MKKIFLALFLSEASYESRVRIARVPNVQGDWETRWARRQSES
jgi:hypothetical protein